MPETWHKKTKDEQGRNTERQRQKYSGDTPCFFGAKILRSYARCKKNIQRLSVAGL